MAKINIGSTRFETVSLRSSARPVLIAALTLTLGMTGCPFIDLMPTPRAGAPTVDVGAEWYCDRTDLQLKVVITNKGNANAPASSTAVTFGLRGGNSAVEQATPAISAGGSATLLFEIPSGCFSPDCSYTITADSQGQVSESNDANNEVSGICIG